jgi:metal transporter CNNM
MPYRNLLLVLLGACQSLGAILMIHAGSNFAVDDLCHHADDFDYCAAFIDGLVEKELQSHNLRRGAARRQLNEKPSLEERDLVFYLFNIGGATLSVIFVAIISGMFLGFMTLDGMDLRIKMRAAVDPTEKDAAAAIFPLVDQNHRLMATLLVMNALAYECLPLFLDNMLPTWMTILFSVTLLLVFGEIIPSAIFTGPDQLILASKLAPLVKTFMAILHPITHPLVKLIDRLVPSHESEEDEEYNRAELSALVRIQFEERMRAQRQKEMLNAITHGGGNKRTSLKVTKMGALPNQLHHEKQRQQQLINDSYFNSCRNWRRLKKEIIKAVSEKQQQRNDSAISLGSLFDVNEKAAFDGITGIPGTPKRDVKPTHRRNLSSSSGSSFGSDIAFEQIAPPLEHTEVRAVEGALNLKTMCALDVYTPLRTIYAVPEDLELTKQTVAEIYGQGYSRVPVYDPKGKDNTAMKGILMTRQLIMIDWDDERTVSSLPLYIPPCVSPRMNLIKLLHLLRKGGSLMAFVTAGPHIAERALEEGRAIPPEAGFLGLVTLQDVLESLIQERIYDEGDIKQQNLASAVLTNWAATVLQRFAKRQKIRRSNSITGSINLPSSDNGSFLADEGTPLLNSRC